VGVYEQLFQGILRLAREKEIELGKLQAIDSTHTEAGVDVGKEDRQGKGGGEPGDRDAHWGVKESRIGGKKVKRCKYFYGYKQHVSLNAASELVTAVVHTPGNALDGNYLGRLVGRDEEVGVEAQVYAADRAYDDGEKHLFLWDRGLNSAIRLKSYRTGKKDRNKGV